MPKTDIGPIALGAFKRFGLNEDYPEVRLVDPEHGMIGSKRIARAVKFESGPDAVYINKRYLDSDPAKLDEYIQHEASHIAAWRKHGPQISEHGRDWRRLCLALASHPRVCKTNR
tara:strand:- start:2682 stop:3026 length:345 start_codon:yes stop_codon:yes gene_type:complete